MHLGATAKQIASIARAERARAMAEKYRAGATLQEIGNYYGLTRERVRQLMTWELGVTRNDGGRAQRTAVRKKAATGRVELSFLRRHGMTRTEFRALDAMRDSAGRHPVRKFQEQRRNARVRNISWDLTFAEWWAIWEASGKWRLRGRGHGYAMARHGDVGPYSVGNVKIIAGTENAREFMTRRLLDIKNGKHAPFRNRKTNPCHGLSVGDSIAVQPRKAEHFRSSAFVIAKKYGWKFKTTVRDGTITVTRLS